MPTTHLSSLDYTHLETFDLPLSFQFTEVSMHVSDKLACECLDPGVL